MKISISLLANTAGFDTDIQRSARTMARELRAAEAQARASANAVQAETARLAREAAQAQAQTAQRIRGITQNVVGLGATIAGALGVNRFVQLSDEAASLNARLKLATNGSQEFKRAQEGLFEISQRNNAAFADTAQLYTRLAASQKDLNATQDDLLKFVGGIAGALRVTGTSGAAASGALLQLSQALAAGTVRAEEFNSVNEGAPEILRVVAQNIAGVDGNLGKLRQRVLDGTLTSREFFEAFLRGTDELNTRAAQIPQTVGGALQNFENVLLKTAGSIDQTTGLTRRFAAGIADVTASLESGALAAALTGLGSAAAFVVDNFVPLATFFIGRAAVPALFAAATAAATTLVQTISLLGPVLGTAAAAGLGLQAALAPLITTTGLIVTGTAALAAGFVYLATTESGSERITRELVEAKNKLKTASEENAEAALEEAFAKRQVALAELEQLRAAARQSPFVAGVGQRAQRTALEADLDALDVQITDLQRRLAGDFVAPSLVGNGFLIDAEQAKEAARLLSDARTKAEQYADVQKRVRALVDGGALSQEQANKVLEDARRKLLDEGKALSASARARLEHTQQIKDWQQAYEAATERLQSFEEDLRQQVDTFGLSEDAVLAYRLSVGDLADEVANAGTRGAAFAEAITEQARKLRDLKAAQDAYNGALANQRDLDAAQRGFERRLADIGAGPAQRRFSAGVNDIEDQVNQRNQALEDRRNAGQVSPDQYRTQLDAITLFQTQAMAQWDRYFGELEARNADFTLQFNDALLSYADSLRGIGGELGGTLVSAIDSATSATANLAAETLLWGNGGAEAAKAIARTLLTEVVSGFIKAGIQASGFYALQQAGIVATTATSTAAQASTAATAAATNASIAATAAPAAALTSLASFGSNAIPAAIGIALVSGAIGALVAGSFATGGPVSGPGTGTSDSIVARLSNGEFVMTAEATRRLGTSFLSSLNEGAMPMFSGGGLASGSAVALAPPRLAGAAVAAGSSGLSVRVENYNSQSNAVQLRTEVEEGPDGVLTVRNFADAAEDNASLIGRTLSRVGGYRRRGNI